jgi:DNA replication ATP-dependent helicase Dna2
MNANEAKSIARLIFAFSEHYGEKKMTIGVITPFRAQIATIKNALKEQNIADENITIDTVERYQGGARDIILLSLCITHKRQLSSLVSLSEEGVDRKLNVALTRAKQHLVVLGNADILNESVIYKEFIFRYGI